jgi:diguanylate cyclase (GGDEF)-like protein/putative nucleotidyltransferase with HDIG domain
MPTQGLSRWARVYVGTIAALGVCAIAQSVYALYTVPRGWDWFILAILTLISGSATVKLPSVPATISISETFVFTSVLLFGPAAGTLTVALDALVISLWLARRGHPFYRIAFNICALPASLWLAAHLFYFVWGGQPLSVAPPTVQIQIGTLLVPLVLFTVTYYLLNSWLIAFAISLEKQLSPLRVWKDNFAWLSLNYFGGASVAALLVTYTRNIDYTYLAFVLPLLAVLYFTFSMSMGRVEDANRHLAELNSLYMSTIETLAMAIDAKDQITHGHIRRVQQYATGLARALGVKDSAQLRAIEAASLLHDMGKLAVPEYILNKPGPLTPAEFEKMKLHASAGADILSAIDFPYPVVPIVRHHHESWNGTGYPDGLTGAQIPIGARILSVVDCFDALTSDRPYRPRLTDGEAIKILLNRRGTMYDPLIVDTFIHVHREIVPAMDDHVAQGKDGLSVLTRGLTATEIAAPGARLDDIAASTEEMLVLYDLAQSLTGRLELPEAADVISKHIRRIVPASTCVLFVYDEQLDELYAAHAAGENAPQFSGVRIPRGQRLTGWVAANKQTILNSDPVLDLGEAARAMRPRFYSCLSTPLLSDAELVGVLTLYSAQQNAFTEDHRRIIEVVARQVAQTVRHAVEFNQNRGTNQNDQLARLPNLQDLCRFVEAAMTAESEPAALSLVLIELRSVKAISRRSEKDAWNRALGQALDPIKKALRGDDLLYRYGPDEFVVVLTQTDRQAANGVADRIAAKIAEQSSGSEGPEEQRLAVLLGVASAPADGTGVEALVSAARRRERGGPNLSPQSPRSVH